MLGVTLGPLSPLVVYRQFIPVLREGKLPINRVTGAAHSAHDPAIWVSYDEAVALTNTWGLSAFGIGFVLTAADPFFCLDIDGALQPDGAWSPLSQQLVAALPGCVTEVSQSGRGLHVFGRRSPLPVHASKNVDLHIELYHENRYILLGSNAVGTMADDCPAIDSVIAAVFKPREHVNVAHGAGPGPEWRGPTDDAEILRRAMLSSSAAAAFSGKARFLDLWTADATVLSKTYPTADATSADPFDRSSADAALAQHLAFWTGRDVERIERLMRASGLARPKYDREDYLPRTIVNACSMQKDILRDAPPLANPAQAALAGAATPVLQGDSQTILGPREQAELFAGCVYVLDQHRVLVPGGRMLRPDQFKAFFGGRTFIMDNRNERTSRDAFEAFTQSQAVATPRADTTCFRPTLSPGAIITTNGTTRANTWWPGVGTRAAGDVGPFLRHMGKLVPNPRDLRALLSIVARWVQSPGHKSPFCIALQGVEGNGKSFFTKAVAHCFGPRYVHWPKASKITGQFNGWLRDKLLICVEDIYVSQDVDVLEDLKPMISGGAALEIESKGVDSFSTEIYCNFILTMNGKNGVKKTKNDRRFTVLWCAQQTLEDLALWGMTGEYMAALYAWAEAGGWAIIHDFLATYPIDPEFDPAGTCQRAPTLSMTAAAIEAGQGRIEQEILEAVAVDRPGFCGGWISTVMLDTMLRTLKLDNRLPRSRRKEVLESLGYVIHPGLVGGRTDNPTLPDGTKTILFVRADRLDLAEVCGGGNIARVYRESQSPK